MGPLDGALVLAKLEGEELAAFVLLDIAIVVALARVVGTLFKKIRQPAVVGEIIAGILLGPTVLGAFPGDPTNDVFPTEVRPFLTVVATLGLVIFMFIVGLELDTRLIKGKERIAATISVSSVILPFLSGMLLALVLYSSHDVVGGEEVDFLPFALFIGASMSVTAFPVLARILSERRMNRTALGAIALACAAVDDILAWSMLAVVLAVVSSGSALDLPRILLESLIFVAIMFRVVKPQLERLAAKYRAEGRLTPNILGVVVVGFLLSAFITSEIGIHSIFGAFIFGAIMPREGTSELFEEILVRLEQVSLLLLLPVFFIVTGLGVNVRGLGPTGFAQLGLVLVAACAGKFLGAYVAARAQRLGSRHAAAIGVLMNTRGLTELVILNIGLEFGVLTRDLFTMLVIMAIFTTIITEPLLRLVYPERLLQRDIRAAEREGTEQYDFRVLLAAEDLAGAKPLVDVGLALAAREGSSQLVISSFTRRRAPVEVGGGVTTDLARMAEMMDVAAELEKYVEGRGAACSVRQQFSDDPGGDLIEQVEAVDPAFVLLLAESEEAARLLEESVHTLLVVDEPEDVPAPPARVVAAESHPSVVEAAVRLGLGWDAPVALGDGGRGAKDLRDRLERAGVPLAGDPAPGKAAGVVVTSESAPSREAGQYVIRVQAPDRDNARLSGLLDGLSEQVAP